MMLDARLGIQLSKKREKKHVSLSETTIEKIQEFADSEGLSFSRAMEVLSLSALGGSEQAMGLAAYLGDMIRKEANQHYNRFAKLIVHAGIEAGTAKEMARGAYSMGMFDRYMAHRRSGGKEGGYIDFMHTFGISEKDDNVLKEVADKRMARARYEAVKRLKMPVQELQEIMEEAERSEKVFAEKLDRETMKT